jgi:hypothetical protein
MPRQTNRPTGPSKDSSSRSSKPTVQQLESRDVPATVSGVIYADVNGNGFRDTGEQGIGNVTVNFDINGDGVVDSQVLSGSDGTYNAPGLISGPTTITVQPNSGGLTATTRVIQIGAADIGGLNIGIRPTGSVTGTVFTDINGNGTRDDGEFGVAGTVVSLDLNGDGINEFSSSSNADGFYQFFGVMDGTHKVSITNPPNYQSTSANPQSLTISGGVGISNANFGLRPLTGIAGKIFLGDIANNVGMPGVKVKLDLFNDGSIDQTATTDASGNYVFTNVPSGFHAVSVTAPPGTVYSTADGTNKQILAVNESIRDNVNFGLTYPGRLAGTMFLDTNGNGTKDDGEAGFRLTNLQVDLYGSGQLVNVSAKSNADGTFSVAGLPDGNHFLVLNTPGGYAPTTATRLPFTITSGSTATLDPIGLKAALSKNLLIGNGSFSGSQAYTFTTNSDGTLKASLGQTINPPGVGGTRTVTGDFNGDGIEDLIVASGPGQRATVRVFDGKTGSELVSGGIQVFEPTFVGGLNIATGDFNGDGKADVVVAADTGGGPRVQILNAAQFQAGANSGAGRVLADFLGIDDAKFRGGARVSVGDFNGDGVQDLVVAAGQGGGPRVAIFNGNSLTPGSTPSRLVADFFVFEEGLRNGAVVAVGDVNGDGKADLITGAGPGGAPRVVAYSGMGVMAGEGINSVRIADFFVQDNVSSRAGTRITVKDVDGDGKADMIASNGSQAYVYTAATISKYYANPNQTATSPTPDTTLQPFGDRTDNVFLG